MHVCIYPTRSMRSQTWPFGRGLNPENMAPSYKSHVPALHRATNDPSPSSSRSKGTQLNPSLQASGTPELPLPLSETKCVPAIDQVHVLALQEGFWASSCPPSHRDEQKESSLISTFKCCGDSPFQHRTLGREPGMGWGMGPSFFRGDLCHQDVPPGIHPLSMGLGSACLTSPPLLPASIWLLLYSLSLVVLLSWH